MNNNNNIDIISGDLKWEDILLSGNITSGIRYYKDSAFNGFQQMATTIVPNDIKVGILHCIHEPSIEPLLFEPWIKYTHPSCIYYKKYYKGGIFAHWNIQMSMRRIS